MPCLFEIWNKTSSKSNWKQWWVSWASNFKVRAFGKQLIHPTHSLSAHLCFSCFYCLFSLGPEIDISVSKLLGFETFANFWGFQFQFRKIRFRKKLVSEKSLGFGFRKLGLGRKISVSEKFGLGKKSRFRKKKLRYLFRLTFWYRHSVLVPELCL